MIIKCPKCGAGVDEINMYTDIHLVHVDYDEESNQFIIPIVESNAVEVVNCECLECGNEWEWDAYRRNSDNLEYIKDQIAQGVVK